MTYVITENCIKCKYTDCVEVCPVDCFHEGPNFLVINPEECIDCSICEPECPINAIKPDTDQGLDSWVELNTKYSSVWPNITKKRPEDVPKDQEKWRGQKNKMKYFSEMPGKGD